MTNPRGWLDLDALLDIDPAPFVFLNELIDQAGRSEAQPLERDEISREDCIEVIHRIAKRIEEIG